jgi:ABC-type sugar transport system permease subunit
MAKDRLIKSLTGESKIENQNKIAYLFILPWILGFAAFVIYPFIKTIYNTFFTITAEAVGLTYQFNLMEAGGNYGISFRSTDFLPALVDFIIMEATYVPTIIIVAFILAILLNTGVKGQGVFRVIYFLPVIIMSGPVTGILKYNGAGSLLSYTDNIIFKMLVSYSPGFAHALSGLFENFTMVLWFSGIPIILFINALQKINVNLYEAAKIDGANGWQILWKIKVPIVKPTAFVSAVFVIVQLGTYSLNPVYSIIRSKIYEKAAGIGLASTYAFIYSLVVFAIMAIVYLLIGRPEKGKTVRLTSIQRRNMEALAARRKLAKAGGDDR